MMVSTTARYSLACVSSAPSNRGYADIHEKFMLRQPSRNETCLVFVGLRTFTEILMGPVGERSPERFSRLNADAAQ